MAHRQGVLPCCVDDAQATISTCCAAASWAVILDLPFSSLRCLDLGTGSAIAPDPSCLITSSNGIRMMPRICKFYVELFTGSAHDDDGDDTKMRGDGNSARSPLAKAIEDLGYDFLVLKLKPAHEATLQKLIRSHKETRRGEGIVRELLLTCSLRAADSSNRAVQRNAFSTLHTILYAVLHHAVPRARPLDALELILWRGRGANYVRGVLQTVCSALKDPEIPHDSLDAALKVIIAIASASINLHQNPLLELLYTEKVFNVLMALLTTEKKMNVLPISARVKILVILVPMIHFKRFEAHNSGLEVISKRLSSSQLGSFNACLSSVLRLVQHLFADLPEPSLAAIEAATAATAASSSAEKSRKKKEEEEKKKGASEGGGGGTHHSDDTTSKESLLPPKGEDADKHSKSSTTTLEEKKAKNQNHLVTQQQQQQQQPISTFSRSRHVVSPSPFGSSFSSGLSAIAGLLGTLMESDPVPTHTRKMQSARRKKIIAGGERVSSISSRSSTRENTNHRQLNADGRMSTEKCFRRARQSVVDLSLFLLHVMVRDNKKYLIRVAKIARLPPTKKRKKKKKNDREKKEKRQESSSSSSSSSSLPTPPPAPPAVAPTCPATIVEQYLSLCSVIMQQPLRPRALLSMKLCLAVAHQMSQDTPSNVVLFSMKPDKSLRCADLLTFKRNAAAGEVLGGAASDYEIKTAASRAGKWVRVFASTHQENSALITSARNTSRAVAPTTKAPSPPPLICELFSSVMGFFRRQIPQLARLSDNVANTLVVLLDVLYRHFTYQLHARVEPEARHAMANIYADLGCLLIDMIVALGNVPALARNSSSSSSSNSSSSSSSSSSSKSSNQKAKTGVATSGDSAPPLLQTLYQSSHFLHLLLCVRDKVLLDDDDDDDDDDESSDDDGNDDDHHTDGKTQENGGSSSSSSNNSTISGSFFGWGGRTATPDASTSTATKKSEKKKKKKMMKKQKRSSAKAHSSSGGSTRPVTRVLFELTRNEPELARVKERLKWSPIVQEELSAIASAAANLERAFDEKTGYTTTTTTTPPKDTPVSNKRMHE
eukprot:jgi/Bigna1/66524/fgenesh1_pg.1_\